MGEVVRPHGMLGVSLTRLSHPRSPHRCHWRAVKPQTLEQGASVSCGRAPLGKIGQLGGVCRPQVLSETFWQAEGRNSETAGNAESIPKRPLTSQKPPGLSRAEVKPQALEQCVCVSSTRPPQAKM